MFFVLEKFQIQFICRHQIASSTKRNTEQIYAVNSGVNIDATRTQRRGSRQQHLTTR